MKTFLIGILAISLVPRLWAQEQFEEQIPKTSEEQFYEGEQVNPEAFQGQGWERQNEEEAPFDAYEEIYPYEDPALEEEQEYLLEDEEVSGENF